MTQPTGPLTPSVAPRRDGKPLKVALLSFAHTHAAAYARALADSTDVEILAADPDGADSTDPGPRGARLADELGVHYVDSYDEAFAWQPDAVVVTTENSRHRTVVERAAVAGADILCEKPMATTLADAQAMCEAVDHAGVLFMMAYPVRFSSTFTALREAVASGRLGTVIGIRGTNNGKLPRGERAWFTDASLAGGGVLVDHVVHCAQLIDELLDRPASSVRAVANRILHADSGVDVETGGLVTLQYPDGVIATIDCSWSQPANAPTWGGVTLEVVGTHGSIDIAPFAQHVAGTNAGGPVHLPVGDDLDGAMIADFLDCVRTRRAPVADAGVGLRTLQVVDAARRSAADGQPVTT